MQKEAKNEEKSAGFSSGIARNGASRGRTCCEVGRVRRHLAPARVAGGLLK